MLLAPANHITTSYTSTQQLTGHATSIITSSRGKSPRPAPALRHCSSTRCPIGFSHFLSRSMSFLKYQKGGQSFEGLNQLLFDIWEYRLRLTKELSLLSKVFTFLRMSISYYSLGSCLFLASTSSILQLIFLVSLSYDSYSFFSLLNIALLIFNCFSSSLDINLDNYIVIV